MVIFRRGNSGDSFTSTFCWDYNLGPLFVISIGAIGGSIALWALWLTKKDDPGTWTNTQVTSLMVAAIVFSILTVSPGNINQSEYYH